MTKDELFTRHVGPLVEVLHQTCESLGIPFMATFSLGEMGPDGTEPLITDAYVPKESPSYALLMGLRAVGVLEKDGSVREGGWETAQNPDSRG